MTVIHGSVAAVLMIALGSGPQGPLPASQKPSIDTRIPEPPQKVQKTLPKEQIDAIEKQSTSPKDDPALAKAAARGGKADRLGKTTKERTDAAEAAVAILRKEKGSQASLSLEDMSETLDSMGRVHVLSTPSGASVAVDGVAWKKPTESDGYALQGERRINVSKTSVGTVSLTCTVSREDVIIVQADLKSGKGECK